MKLHPKKSLGQHFLNSPGVLAKIISAARVRPGETVLEIGPGTGILTRALFDVGAKVIAVEKDRRACGLLAEKFGKEIRENRLTLIEADILEMAGPNRLMAAKRTSNHDAAFRSATFLTDEKHGLENGRYALVANIPYYITGAILEAFLEYEPRPDRMILLVQKEVAERIVARDGKESLLSISVKAFGTPKIIAKVPRGAFTPAPKVDSAILAISDITDERFMHAEGEKDGTAKENGRETVERFFNIVRAGFAHKRKYARRNMEVVLRPEELTEIWDRTGLDIKARAEDLTLGQWLAITDAAVGNSRK